MSAIVLTYSSKSSTAHLDQLDPVQRSELDALVQKLNSVQNTGVLQTTFSVGKIVVDQVFDGDVNRFRLQAEGNTTWRALTEHPALSISHSALWYSVALHENFHVLGDDVAESLTASHHRRLAHIADIAARRQLAERVLAEKLTVKQLEAALKGDKSADGATKRGRPSIPEPLKVLARAGRELDGLAKKGALDDDTRVKALEAARAIAAKAAALIDRLGGEV
jgi:hypothetical protein